MNPLKTWIFEPSEARTGRTLASNEVLQMNSRQIIGKVIGIAEIFVSEITARQIGENEDGLFCYKGKVRCGNDDSLIEAVVLAFNAPGNEDVATLHWQLCSLNHPFIMPSIGYWSASKQHQGCIAFPYFESTLADYIHKSCKRTVEKKRFTEEFSKLIGCAVRGLQELHDHGYYCPKLSAEFVAVVKQHDSICAKLWYFYPLELGKAKRKDMDWVRLGDIIEEAAWNHNSFTPEIADLCHHMRNGTLKGIEILKHSALLSVRVKFDNIVALNTVALTHCKKSSQTLVPKANLHCSAREEDNDIAMKQIYCDSLDKNKTIASFQNLLDSDVGWISLIPEWIKERHDGLGFRHTTKQDTFRGFLWEIRCLYEHQNKYNPPEDIVIVSPHEFIFYDEKPDLESEVRESWAYLFLVAQKFATSLQLESC